MNPLNRKIKEELLIESILGDKAIRKHPNAYALLESAVRETRLQLNNTEQKIYDIKAGLPPCIVLPEFLSKIEAGKLIEFTLCQESSFRTGTIIKDSKPGIVNSQHRKSIVLSDLGPYVEIFKEKINAVLPFVFGQLNMEVMSPHDFEFQLTATNNEEYFGPHDDNSHPLVNARKITFVYYFYKEPKTYWGGELRFLHKKNSALMARDTIFEPVQNTIIFFRSDIPHEILPVECPSKDFSASRFTVNGWILQIKS